MTSTIDGHIWLDRVAQVLLQKPEETIVPVEDWAEAFHVYNPVTRMPLTTEQLPMYRALSEGRVQDVEVLIAPPGGLERVLCVSATALYDSLGTVLGVLVRGRDVTEAWLQRVEVEVTSSVHLCPCGAWQVQAPLGTPAEWLAEALEEHLAECVVMGASRHLALRAAGG